MFTETMPHQIKARINALRQSYGITATQAQANRAAHLAPTLKAFRPAVYQVGQSIVDLWRESCSCKEARQRKLKGKAPAVKPCPHFLALYLAGEWSPIYSPVNYLQSVGVEKPEIMAVYVTVKGKPGQQFRITHGHTDSKTNRRSFCLAPLNDSVHFYEPAENIRTITPFYGD